jgi:hypothetical protein
MRYCAAMSCLLDSQSSKHFRTINVQSIRQWGNGAFLAVVAFHRINNLRVVNIVISSTPTSTGELRSIEASNPDNKVILREQVFQVLRMLLEREGEIVTREEIKEWLWRDDTVVDFDRSINATITTLRRALGDSDLRLTDPETGNKPVRRPSFSSEIMSPRPN